LLNASSKIFVDDGPNGKAAEVRGASSSTPATENTCKMFQFLIIFISPLRSGLADHVPSVKYQFHLLDDAGSEASRRRGWHDS